MTHSAAGAIAESAGATPAVADFIVSKTGWKKSRVSP
jgi:hypothetical protein